MQAVKKYLLINIECEQNKSISDYVELFENSVFLKKYLTDGQTTILSHPKTIFSNLSSILTFSKSFDKNSFQQQSGYNNFEEKQQFAENQPKQIESGQFDEDMNEIRFIDQPKFYNEVSNNIQTVLITNNQKNAVFAAQVKLDYVYYEDFQNTEQVIKTIKANQQKNLFIIDILANKFDAKTFDNLNENLNNLFQFFVRIIISPLDNSIDCGKLIKINQIGFENQPQILNIIPNQTWQYQKGNLIQNQNLDFEFAISIFYEQNNNRKDQIDSFLQFKTLQGLSLVSNRIINDFYLFREIIFKLGKLPKFGA